MVQNPPRWLPDLRAQTSGGAGGWRQQAGTVFPFSWPWGKADAAREGGPWAQLQSPLPVPSLSLWQGDGGGAGAPPPSCLRCVPGLAFFVGADTNVTAGHGTEGLTCGTAKGCTGKGLV